MKSLILKVGAAKLTIIIPGIIILIIGIHNYLQMENFDLISIFLYFLPIIFASWAVYTYIFLSKTIEEAKQEKQKENEIKQRQEKFERFSLDFEKTKLKFPTGLNVFSDEYIKKLIYIYFEKHIDSLGLDVLLMHDFAIEISEKMEIPIEESMCLINFFQVEGLNEIFQD